MSPFAPAPANHSAPITTISSENEWTKREEAGKKFSCKPDNESAQLLNEGSWQTAFRLVTGCFSFVSGSSNRKVHLFPTGTLVSSSDNFKGTLHVQGRREGVGQQALLDNFHKRINFHDDFSVS